MTALAPKLLMLALELSTASIAPASSVWPVAACVSEMTNLPLPKTLPRVYRSDQWTFDATGECCNGKGQPARFTAKITTRAVAFYYWNHRTILLSASAEPKHLAHELAVYFKHQTLTYPATLAEKHAIDAWADQVERHYNFQDCAK